MSSSKWPPTGGGSEYWGDAEADVGSFPPGAVDCEVRLACTSRILYKWDAGGGIWVPITAPITGVLPANRAIITDGSGNLAASDVTSTELAFLDGLTSNVESHITDTTIHFTVGSIDHTAIQNIGTNSHAAIDSHIADGTIHFTEGSIDHTAIQNIGTNSHAAIDSHIADSTIHFTVGSIDHTSILNIGTNSHAAIDSHIADSTIHFTEGSIDHTAIQNIGTNSHAAIDSHIADGTIHFTEGSIDHTAILNIGTNSHAQIDTAITNSTNHIANTSNPHSVTAAQAGAQPDVITTEGDIIIGNGSGDGVRLPIGPATQVLTSNGTTAAWAAAGVTGPGSIPLGAIIPIAANLTGASAIPATGTVDANGFQYCDGAAINAGATMSGTIYNLTDERFLAGSTTAGTTGGSNTLIDHTHTDTLALASGTLNSGTATSAGTHTHDTIANHSHTFNGSTTSTVSAGAHTHTISAVSNTQPQHNFAGGGEAGLDHPVVNAGPTASDGAHTHDFTPVGANVANGGHTHTSTGTAHTHPVTGSVATALSGSVGTGSAPSSTNSRPQYISVQYVMRVS